MFSSQSAPTFPPAQFRAVILCGYGQDLFPIVEPPESESDIDSDQDAARPTNPQGLTKALLPVAGRKMIDWVLDRIEQAGIFDSLILTPTSIAGPLSSHIRTRRANTPEVSGNSKTPSPKLEIEQVPENIARKGAAWVLHWALESDFIKTDFVVLPCDLLLIPADLSDSSPLATLINKHRVQNHVFTTLFYTRAAANMDPKKGPSEVVTVYDGASDILLDIRDLDDYPDEIPIRASLLSRYPSFQLSTSLLPTQIYVFSSLVIPVLLSPENTKRIKRTESLKELVGWMARLQWRYNGVNAIGENPNLDTGLVKKLTPYGCGLMIWTEKEGFCSRGNSISTWVELNRAALKLLPPTPVATSTPPGVFISPDAHLHHTVYANLGEKVGIKRSIIGKGCIIGKGVKLTNCVVMDNVVISENSKLDNCVLSNGVQVGSGSVIKDCEIGSNVCIDAGSQLKSEQLTADE